MIYVLGLVPSHRGSIEYYIRYRSKLLVVRLAYSTPFTSFDLR